jgi:ketosteroid isomerase-like protein
MPKSPHDAAQAFVTAINAADISALRALMTDSHTFTDARGNSFSGADKMQLGWQHFFHAYPGYQITITYTFAEENRAALFGNATGGWRINDTNHPQRWTVSAAWLAEVENEKISHWTVFCDTIWVNPPH